MSLFIPIPATNQFIDHLPVSSANALRQAGRTSELESGEVLTEPGLPVEQVLFPLTAIFSITTRVSGHPALAIGLIGHEGMLGATLALGIDRHPMRCTVQQAGLALVLPKAAFRQQLRRSPALAGTIHGYLFVLGQQLAQTTACHSFHTVVQRLARWLLMMDERSRGQPLMLTHQSLSEMLGVRRSAITIAAGQLQTEELIRYARGRIELLSRQGLESTACECHAAAQASYRLEFGRSGSGGAK
jgi:CRP-like cAMP-binding protein